MSSRSCETLARVAGHLNAGNGFAGRLPALVLMTDEKRGFDAIASARALPQGAAIILRHSKGRERAKLARILAPLAHEHGLLLLIAGDTELASAVEAQGLHLPETRAREAAHWRALRPHWLITVAAHSAQALNIGKLAGADAAFLAPVFPTASHPKRAALGPQRFLMLAANAGLPVYALGGVNARNAVLLAGPNVAGIAAVAALHVA